MIPSPVPITATRHTPSVLPSTPEAMGVVSVPSPNFQKPAPFPSQLTSQLLSSSNSDALETTHHQVAKTLCPGAWPSRSAETRTCMNQALHALSLGLWLPWGIKMVTTNYKACPPCRTGRATETFISANHRDTARPRESHIQPTSQLRKLRLRG